MMHIGDLIDLTMTALIHVILLTDPPTEGCLCHDYRSTSASRRLVLF